MTTISRVDGWDSVLVSEIDTYSKIPFEWGKNDCVTVAFNILRAMTGVDFMDNYRGRWKTAIGAARILKKHGMSLAPPIDEVMKKYNINRKGTNFVQRGDLCLCVVDAKEYLGVFCGQGVYVTGENGMVLLASEKIITVWGV